MLDIIVDRYGRLVHPESEWLFASGDPTFFRSCALANLEGGHPEASFYEYPPKPQGERTLANFRFCAFKSLSRSIQEASGDNDYLASGYSDEVAGLSPQSVCKLIPSESGF